MTEGYTKISNLMGCQDTCAIYRRFRRLNSLNLLYLQAELTHLEEELEILAKRDAADPERQFHARDWWSLAHNNDEGDEGYDEEAAEQWEKVLEVREKLEQYNDTLLKQAKIARLGAPAPQDVNFLREWWRRPRMGYFPLVGADRHSYSEEYDRDLVAVKARSAPDLFTRWFNDGLVSRWHGYFGRKVKDQTELGIGHGIYEYSDAWLAGAARIIATVVASLLPTCSVVLQYFIRDDLVKLYLIVLASAVFALALAAMTNARMVEVFAATSAYAAVNVVFLTNTVVEIAG
ncbi:hypothetical protein PG999_000345 [Apiospora kogelbergensis]|uniref:DUF6594 domain-containing protein n=1 Tax=Apiospora kogelbergensis TaxID=1337665 RepID=A0AAW0RBI3_9PEZI